jgi:hypothetical protein
MIRILCLAVVGLTSLVAMGQDPTVPSQAILEKLKKENSSVTNEVARSSPKMKLKAIVMIDRDHGVATIEADGQRFRVRLERSSESELKSRTVAAPNATRVVEAVQIGGVQYTVEDFSTRTIVLTDGVRRVLVQ